MNELSHELSLLKEIGQYRQFRTIEPLPHGSAMLNAESMLNLSSNDYLGISIDASLLSEFNAWHASQAGHNPYGACSSRLLTGNYPLYNEVENLLADLYHRPALFFNSGYHANMGILPALTNKDDLILSDKLIHASLIDGIRLCQATHLRYRHLDYDQIKKILHDKRHLYRHVFIVTESIFSMDGDAADLTQLVAIKQQFNAFLYVDEAHAVGAIANDGLGLAQAQNVLNHIDLLVGTMGKALASVGAWVICNDVFKQLLINKCRTLIFTTALPPVNMAWSLFVIQKMASFQPRRLKLELLWKHLAVKLNDAGFTVDAQSHILPVMVGENQAAVNLAQCLQQQGFLVMAVRPPTVPVGTARLRLSLTAAIEPPSLTAFVDTLKQAFQPQTLNV